jgi:Predicted phosphohydrolases
MKNHLLPLLLLAVIILAVWYLSRRSAFIFGCKPTWFYIGYALLFVGCAFFTFAGARPWTCSPLGHVCFCFASELLGVLLYLLLIMLAVDIMQLFAHFPARTFGLIVGLLTAGVCAAATINAFVPRLTPVTVELPNLRQPVRAVLLTDTHLGHFRGRRHVQRLVNKINQAQPDLIFFTGDCFESPYNLNIRTVEPFRQLNAPVYFVSGNHDGYVGTDSVKSLLRQVGVRVMDTEVAEACGLQIVGLDYMRADEQDGNSMHAPVGDATIESVSKELIRKGELPIVVLHHNPCGGEYLEKAGVDLYLAGHTHGGQLYPLIWINDRIFQFNRGLYRLGNMQAYTSCGSGTFGPPMRLGTRSEITVMEMRPEK